MTLWPPWPVSWGGQLRDEVGVAVAGEGVDQLADA